ncbi:MAG: hypothetical protein HN742_16890 [Lentisphaerae bacterium]|jgi:hypothetical protein|nr:hypothetical protein [Lentisphaerota bacterium]MBT5609139.1 hypothetical protein [Lentisphaerota bacterium]MBT7054181.1 hypothetical protein [Lentisphaerota bacterium]MBT7843558.1 hypothetical protein [Lentisphaerota bacterium]
MSRPPVILSLALTVVLCFPGAPVQAGKLLSVGSARTAPTIDGQLRTNEWDSFAAGTGFEELRAGGVAEAQPVFHTTFDAEHFLIAIRVPRSPGSRLVSAAADRDCALHRDDSLEVFLQPDPAAPAYYQFCVNAGGTVMDAKARDTAWNAEWEAKVRQTSVGWSAEFAIPWAVMGCRRVPSVVGFNVSWNCQSGAPGSYSWARMVDTFHDTSRFARLRLLERGTAFQLTDLGDWQAGIVALDVCLLNGDAPFGVTLKDQDGAQIKAFGTTLGREIVTLPLPMDGRFPKGATYTLEYVCGAFAEGDLRLVVKPGIEVKITKRMLAEEVDVQVDASGLRGYSAGASLDIALSRKEDGYIISRMAPRVGKSKRATQTFDILDFPPGTYQVTVTARAANGVSLTSSTAAFELLGEKPPWRDCREGITDRVLPPWTPVMPDREYIRVWGRDYAFATAFLPNGIRTREREILAGPIRLICSASGADTPWRMGPVDLTDHSSVRAVLEARQETEDVVVDGRSTVEYDGMIRLDLKVRRKEKQKPRKRRRAKKEDEAPPLRVSLRLVVPIKEEHARYLYHFPGRWRSAFNVGELPAEGWSSPFKPYVWLGDEWRGLAWFCESDQNWRPGDAARSIRVLRRGRRVDLVLDLLHEQDLSEPIAFTMGLQATPVKPMTPDVWDYRIIHKGRYGLEKPAPAPSGTISWPAEGLFDLERGTVECRVRPEFDPEVVVPDGVSRGQYNQHLFSFEFDASRKVAFYWNIDDRGMRAYVQTGRGEFPAMVGGAVPMQRGQWHHVAMTWGDELAIVVDGETIAAKPHVGTLSGDAADATLRLGFGAGACAFVVDEFRISDTIRVFENLNRPLRGDQHTLLLERFDETFTPDGARRTMPSRVGAGAAAAGGLPSPDCAFVEGHFGRALNLGGTGERTSPLARYARLGVRTICFHEHWTPVQNSHISADPKGLQALVDGCHANGIQLLPYWGYQMADTHPGWEKYSAECLVQPRGGGYHRLPEQRAYTSCLNSPWQDYMAWSIAKTIDEFGIDGVYLDGTAAPWACSNAHHGCGYTDSSGKRKPTYPIFATRAMMRRIYAIVKSRKPRGQVNVHNSTMMVIPTLAWATSTWDGEQFGSVDRGPHFEELLPLDAFRAEFTGQPWGVPAEFLCYDRPYTQSEALAFALLHDVLVRPKDVRLVSGIWSAMETFGRSEATWLPYWENEGVIKCTPPAVRASVYTRGAKGAMVVVSNLGSAPVEAQVSLDARALHLPTGERTVTDALNGRAIPMVDQVLTVPLQPLGWRLVHIR